MRVHLYIPTLNGGERFLELLDWLGRQTLPLQRCVVIDSGSTDVTVAAAQASGCEVIGLGNDGFDHGGTRQRAVDAFPEADVYRSEEHTSELQSLMRISYAGFC